MVVLSISITATRSSPDFSASEHASPHASIVDAIRKLPQTYQRGGGRCGGGEADVWGGAASVGRWRRVAAEVCIGRPHLDNVASARIFTEAEDAVRVGLEQRQHGIHRGRRAADAKGRQPLGDAVRARKDRSAHELRAGLDVELGQLARRVRMHRTAADVHALEHGQDAGLLVAHDRAQNLVVGHHRHHDLDVGRRGARRRRARRALPQTHGRKLEAGRARDGGVCE